MLQADCAPLATHKDVFAFASLASPDNNNLYRCIAAAMCVTLPSSTLRPSPLTLPALVSHANGGHVQAARGALCGAVRNDIVTDTLLHAAQPPPPPAPPLNRPSLHNPSYS